MPIYSRYILIALMAIVAGLAPGKAAAKDNKIEPLTTVCSCYCSRVTGQRMEHVLTLGACSVGILGQQCRTVSNRAGVFEGCRQCLRKGQNGELEQCVNIGGSAFEQGPGGGSTPKPPKWRPRPEARPPTAPARPN